MKPTCSKLVLPFLDGVTLAYAERTNRDWSKAIQQVDLWRPLCEKYLSQPHVRVVSLGEDVPWLDVAPTEQVDVHKDTFRQLHKFYKFCTEKELVRCEGTQCRRPHQLIDVKDESNLFCESCNGRWCEDCAEPGPDKQSVPCKECPDFSKISCQECYQEGKTFRCECSHSDSWHSACGRHGWECECGALLCEGCADCHECSANGDEDKDEDEDGEDE
mmetsp:Transcript_35909/g.65922  ORF Transcript_35909/g.65922 Transcript_35909/m.65922 type:complete len:217 (+) Transcript_35909:39-689(+)